MNRLPRPDFTFCFGLCGLLLAACAGEAGTPENSPAASDAGFNQSPDSVAVEDGESFPGVAEEWVALRPSVEGRAIKMLAMNAGAGQPAALVFGAIHGDEALGRELINDLLGQRHEDLLVIAGQLELLLLPAANPDGLEKGTRQNAHGVDCNRNFPASNWSSAYEDVRYFPGDAPNSEPETQNLVEIIAGHQLRLIIAVHSPLREVNYDGPAKEIAQAMAAQNGYPVTASIGYPTPGSLGSYAGIDLGLAVVTLELDGAAAYEILYKDNAEAILAGLRAAAGE